MSKTIWVMCAHSESGDHYECAESWDHEPSQEEINVVRVKLDSNEYDEESDGDWEDDGEASIVLDGKRYISYILDYSINEIIVGE